MSDESGGLLLSFHVSEKVATRHNYRRDTICLRTLCVAIINVKRGEQHEYGEKQKKELNIRIGQRLKTVRENSGYTQETFGISF